MFAQQQQFRKAKVTSRKSRDKSRKSYVKIVL